MVGKFLAKGKFVVGMFCRVVGFFIFWGGHIIGGTFCAVCFAFKYGHMWSVSCFQQKRDMITKKDNHK